MNDFPSVDLSEFARRDVLNPEQRAAKEATAAAAQAYFEPPAPASARTAPQALARVSPRPTANSVVNTAASNSAQRHAVLNINQHGTAIAAAQRSLAATRTALGLKNVDQDLPAGPAAPWTPPSITYRRPGASVPAGATVPSTTPPAAPASPTPSREAAHDRAKREMPSWAVPLFSSPASSTSPPTPPSGAPSASVSAGPRAPSPSFYAPLHDAPVTPRMPDAAPTAGLTTSAEFLATAGGKMLRSAAGKAAGAVGKVAADAARPRSSAPTSYTSGPGWRTN